MQTKEQFKDSLFDLSLEELLDMELTLSNKLIKAKNRILLGGESKEDIEDKLFAVKNRITALKIRC